MVQDSIPIEPDAALLGLFGQRQQLFLGAPFRGCGSFLIKLSQIVQVVDVVAVALEECQSYVLSIFFGFKLPRNWMLCTLEAAICC